MSFKIGDNVSVLDDTIEGVIEEIKGHDICIRDKDNMIFKFKSKELVLSGYQDQALLSYNSKDMAFLKQKYGHSKKKKQEFKKFKNEVVMEVDLHAEKLLTSVKGLDNFDVLNIQINTARRKLEYCIDKKISKIIFIHGVGEGVLKSELGYLLNKYPVKYNDASYQQYGLGATEVYIYQNP